MKRTLIALVLLLLLGALGIWNLRQVDALTNGLCGCIELSIRCMEEGDSAAAKAAVDSALTLWERQERYTHIFLRHSEVDSAADTLYELQEAVYAGDAAQALSAGNPALYHLRSLQSMEHPAWGSVF